MPKVRQNRRPKKKQRVSTVSTVTPDWISEAAIEAFDNDYDSGLYLADRMDVASNDDVPGNNSPDVDVVQNLTAREQVTTTAMDSLLSSSRLYAVAKPIISALQESLNAVIVDADPSILWGAARKAQFIDHILHRTRALFGLSKPTSTAALDSQMIDSAASYLAALQTSKGNNFNDSEYVRLHVLEALIPPVVGSSRAIALRLGVSRGILPRIISKRHAFNGLTAAPIVALTSTVLETDHSLDESASSFEGSQSAEESGSIYLFANLQLDQDDDFFLKNQILIRLV